MGNPQSKYLNCSKCTKPLGYFQKGLYCLQCRTPVCTDCSNREEHNNAPKQGRVCHLCSINISRHKEKRNTMVEERKGEEDSLRIAVMEDLGISRPRNFTQKVSIKFNPTLGTF